MLPRGLLPRSKVALIVEVHTVGDSVETASGPESFHDREEFVFALKAALAVIAGILGTIKLRSGDDLDGNVLFVGEGQGVGKMRAGKAGRVGDHRQHVVSESAVRGQGKIRGVDAAE